MSAVKPPTMEELMGRLRLAEEKLNTVELEKQQEVVLRQQAETQKQQAEERAEAEAAAAKQAELREAAAAKKSEVEKQQLQKEKEELKQAAEYSRMRLIHSGLPQLHDAATHFGSSDGKSKQPANSGGHHP